MSKKERIWRLHEAGLTTRQIAEAVSGLGRDASSTEADRKMAYIRVVLRQRGNEPYSAADRAYLLKRYKAGSLTEAERNKARERYADPIKYAQHRRNVEAYRARKRAEARP